MKTVDDLNATASLRGGVRQVLLGWWRYFENWQGFVDMEHLEPMKNVARTTHKHIEGILAAFRHKVTNAAAEGLNSQIQAFKSAARGLRKFDNYRVRILFYCGKLDLLSAI